MISTAGIDGNRSLDRSRRTKERAGAGADFAQLLGGEGESMVAAAGASTVAGLAGLDALLGLQEVTGDDGEPRRAACRYGTELLDGLEGLRRQVLGGAVAVDDLTALAQTLRARHRRSGDDALEAVIADIELRVEVEIAKLHAGR
ncbi:MAG: flagellar assembly protein FliX [Rhodospirillales bacterium]|jgi:hypothetical protein|nr:flagellar assembly protein FliX [Rhodospirillales bacterium]